MPEAAVTFYKTHWGMKESGSEILFIPIADASANAPSNSTPRILLRVTEDKLAEAKSGREINLEAVEGIRTTSLDLEDKARRLLVKAYGQAAVESMVILDYHGKVGIGTALVKLAGGVALVGAIVGGFIWLRKPKTPAPPVIGSIPPPIPPVRLDDSSV